MAVGKPPHPRGDGDPQDECAAGERSAVVDVRRAESFHSVTSSSGRAKTAKSRYVAGTTSNRTIPPAIAIDTSAACVAAAVWIVRRLPIKSGAWLTNQPHNTAAPVSRHAPRASKYRRRESASSESAAAASPTSSSGSAGPINLCQTLGAAVAATAGAATPRSRTQAPDCRPRRRNCSASRGSFEADTRSATKHAARCAHSTAANAPMTNANGDDQGTWGTGAAPRWEELEASASPPATMPKASGATRLATPN